MTPEKVTAFIADGEDSFIAIMLGDRVFPAVTASSNGASIQAMERAMEVVARRTGKTIRKYEFTQRREVSVIVPAQQP